MKVEQVYYYNVLDVIRKGGTVYAIQPLSKVDQTIDVVNLNKGIVEDVLEVIEYDKDSTMFVQVVE